MLGLLSTGLSYAQTEEPKKEWREIENKNDTQIQSDEELSYPFGGWTDADKYQK